MAFDSEYTFRNTAKRAAERWKGAKEKSAVDQLQPLKEQIMDAFRLTKRIREQLDFRPPLDQLRKTWTDAIEAVGCQGDFDFTDEETI